MVQEFVKTYVEAVVKVLPDGQKRPLTFVFESRKKYAIDRVRRVTRACATKVGGTGIRYTVEILGTTTFLFEDDEGRWFVEARADAICE